MAVERLQVTEPAPAVRGRPRRVTVLLLGGWCALWGAWLAAARARYPLCPYGQRRCGREPMLAWGDTIPYAAVALAGAVGLAALWWWESHRPASTVPASDEQTVRPVRLTRLCAMSFVGVLAAAHLLLLAPMVDHPFCARPVRINDAMAYPLNCDSPLFLELAHHPRESLASGNPRQSRPGYVAVAALATRTIGPAADAMGVGRWYGQADSAYVPLVLLNFVVVAAGVALLAWLLARLGTPPWAAAAVCALLAVNDLTKAFYWTPHQQMFAVFVPVGTIALARWVLLSRPAWWALAVAGFGTGLVSLIYGSALITLGVIGLVLLARGWRGLVLCGVFAGAFTVPTLVWVVICRQVAGSYYNHEIEQYHEFVWLPQAARAGELLKLMGTMTIGTIWELASAAGLVLLVIAVLAAVAVVLGVRLTPGPAEQRAILVASGLTVVGGVAFAWAVGFIAIRLMYHAVPGLLVGLGWLAGRLSSRAPRLVGAGLWLLASGVVAVAVTTEGPYS